MPVASAAAAVVVTACAMAIADEPGSQPVEYGAASGETLTGVRPTSVGLPQIGVEGNVGGGELPSALRAYHDSGDYERDLAVVAGAAKTYLDRRLTDAAATGRRVRTCRTRYRRARGRLYRRVRSCRTRVVRPPGLGGQPAIVLDIDETSLSNYDGLNATNFSSLGTAGPAVLGTGTAIAPTLDLYRDARAKGVAVFFVTGRPDVIRSTTEANLTRVGYDRGWDGLFLKPGDAETRAFKSSTRAELERRGFDIVVNLGDQESDLDGGHAERAFKLPNPFYFISD
jgi:acid phosphatase